MSEERTTLALIIFAAVLAFIIAAARFVWFGSVGCALMTCTSDGRVVW